VHKSITIYEKIIDVKSLDVSNEYNLDVHVKWMQEYKLFILERLATIIRN
jgi:hypothetical protein